MKLMVTEGKLDPDADLAVRQIMDSANELVVRLNSLHGKGIDTYVRVDREPNGQYKLIGCETQPSNCGVVVIGHTPHVSTYVVKGAI